MCVLFYIGIFAGYLLVLKREHRRFPWAPVIKITLIVLLALAGILYVAIAKYGYKIVSHWPFLKH
jgi:sec-independent protein translocase protein TatC